MAVPQKKNVLTFQQLPIFLIFRDVRIVPVFFLLCLFLGTVTPVAASDQDNQTLLNSLMNKASGCYRNGNYDCAWESFESAHQLDPGNSAVLFSYGYYLSRAGNTTKALEKMDASLALNPQNARAWYERGKILDTMGKYPESWASYDRATELSPSYSVSVMDRFPFSVLKNNAIIILLVGGFILLGIYIYFRERRRK